MIEILGFGLLGVVGASLYELAREEREDPRRPTPRPSLEERCPYCHEAFAGAAIERVRCVGCGTRHHAECWTEHGRCSVHGCEGTRPNVRDLGSDVQKVPSDAAVTVTATPEGGPTPPGSSPRAEGAQGPRRDAAPVPATSE